MAALTYTAMNQNHTPRTAALSCIVTTIKHVSLQGPSPQDAVHGMLVHSARLEVFAVALSMRS